MPAAGSLCHAHLHYDVTVQIGHHNYIILGHSMPSTHVYGTGTPTSSNIMSCDNVNIQSVFLSFRLPKSMAVRSRGSRSATRLQEENSLTDHKVGHAKIKSKRPIKRVLAMLLIVLVVFVLYSTPAVLVRYSEWLQKALVFVHHVRTPFYCLLYTSPSPRDATLSRMPSSA